MNYNALPLVLLLAFAPFLQAMGDGLRHGRREVVSSSCCSWDLATCGSNVPTDYCNLSKSNCEVDCSTTTKAEFIDPATRTTCVPRWQGCTSSSLCCGASSCISLAGDVGLYMGCGLQGDGPTVTSTPAPTLVPTTPLAPIRPTRRPTTPRPTRSPTTPRPTKSPTTPRPTRSPTTPRPTRSPTTPRPTRSPTTPRPTKSPTSSTTPKPTTPPTSTPTVAPTPKVTTAPTSTPTVAPTPKITTAPTSTPTAFPTGKPTPVPNNAIFCCSWDLTTCGSNVPTDYCNLSKQNCERDCSSATQAEYIDPTTRTTCTPRWYGCSSTPCCGAATCVQLNGYRGCDLPAPTMAPTFTPPPTPAFITAAKSSERIIVPDPAVPLETSRQNCPHLDAGIVDWNAGSTWGGSVPTGGNVQIPANTRVVIRQSVAGVFGVITIPKTSELILGENASGITLDVGGMDVMGKLTAGSETCRLDTPVTITLYGSRPTDAVTNIRDKTYKGISVNGTLSLHGKRFYRTWTRLAKSVVPGDRVMMLQHQVNWQPGQEVILVTTAMKDSREWHQNEVKIVESVTLNPAAGVGAAVYLTTDITYTHVANNGYQAEVGLLTRTIKIQGAAQDSEPTDPDPLNCVGRDIYGNSGRPCANTELTGFGGHVMVYGQGKGYVEGVELFRMGQTNVLGRYPMHFHLLGDCADCYFRDSSVHRSFYRCVSIHGTNYVNVNENVAYDVTGFCYYLEDGVEHDNTISFNLAAHIHLLGPEAPWGYGQTTDLYQQSNTLTLPADVAASGFYITNVHNNVIGNAASGGWSGFAFPNLPSPIGLSKNANMRPSSAIPLTIDGNTAHSTGWWWYHAGAFYFGGSLYYNNAGVLEYNAGRDFNFNNHGRNTCSRDLCAAGDCSGWCAEYEQLWFRMTNTKAFLVPSVGLGSWSGRMEIVGFEAHDVGLSVEALAAGFWIDNMLAVCRTGHSIALPSGASAASIAANGFVWYDTDQQHIITNSMFRKCGYRSQDYNQYNTAADRGCANEAATGCSSSSAAFGFLTHSDQFNPEVMQGTRNITFDNCGRRFRLDYRGPNLPSTVSGRTQNWLDSDGSVSGLGVPVLIGSGVAAAGLWWTVDDEVVHDPQGPLKFIKQKKDRGLGHFRMYFDYAQHNQVGSSQCGNGNGLPCSPLGYMKHMGKKFSSDNGLPITANAELAGPVGGFSWLLKLFGGSPRQIRFELIEAGPDTPMLLSIAYPIGTSFTITANAAYCSTSQQYSCQQPFHAVNSMAAVRNSTGNTYHFSNEGLLTLRIIQFPQTYVGNPNWFLPKYADIGKWGSGYAIPRFERGGVLLPGLSYGPWLDLLANCPASASNSAYCSQLPPNLDPDVCPAGYLQTAYDACCSGSNCVYADGSSS